MLRVAFLASLLMMLLTIAARGEIRVSPEDVNQAGLEAKNEQLSPPLLVKLQILLDQAGLSPGIIDGSNGANLTEALRLFEARSGLPIDGKLDPDAWQKLQENAGDVLVTYEIETPDAEGPFIDKVPTDYAEMAKMKRLSYTGPAELLSEKFHIHPELLKALNPGASMRPGERIFVPDVAKPAEGEVARIEVDKAAGTVRGYAADDKLLVSYPASIGSEDNPSPEGTMEVKTVAEDPNYSYLPDKNFQQGDNTEPLIIPPGPNNPVGSVWIDLTKDTYGIHGTPDPEQIGKRSSHGCVRLTNWDAEELAHLVKRGTKVTFESPDK